MSDQPAETNVFDSNALTPQAIEAAKRYLGHIAIPRENKPFVIITDQNPSAQAFVLFDPLPSDLNGKPEAWRDLASCKIRIGGTNPAALKIAAKEVLGDRVAVYTAVCSCPICYTGVHEIIINQ